MVNGRAETVETVAVRDPVEDAVGDEAFVELVASVEEGPCTTTGRGQCFTEAGH